VSAVERHLPPRVRHDALAHELRWPLLAALALAASIAGATATGDAHHLPVASPAPSIEFPLHIAADRHSLRDAGGATVIVHGDAAWSLIAEASPRQVDFYLKDRQARGFNALLVNLIEHKFARRAPRNAAGDDPFGPAGPFTTPNEPYFARAEEVLRKAAAGGFLVLLAPAYLGFDGGDEGWYREAKLAGAERLRDYGRYLGARFRNQRNILWVLGGDFAPPDPTLVEALASGIRQADPDALMTGHCSRGRSASSCGPDAAWLDIDAIYTGADVREAATHAYAGPRPFLLIEAIYEAAPAGTARQVRAQAYEALLAGAAGYVYGHEDVWHFDANGVQAPRTDWKSALDAPGARSIQELIVLARQLAPGVLTPDHRGIVRAPRDASRNAAPISATTDRGRAVLSYLPDGDPVIVDTRPLQDTTARGYWIDPVSGGRYPAATADSGDGDGRIVKPIGVNHGGEHDWLLLITSAEPSGERRDAPAAARDARP
jgi:hypothetical protein